MPYLSSNFIRSYNLSDKIIQIQNSVGLKMFNISVCNFQKVTIEGIYMYIFVEDSNPTFSYTLDFTTSLDALTAKTNLKNAINTLRPNCAPAVTLNPNPVTSPVSITLLAYKAAQTGNTLVGLQWYDVSDTTNLLGLGNIVYRVLAKTSNDAYPAGVITITPNIQVKLDTINNYIDSYFDLNKFISYEDHSSITQNDSNSNNVRVYGGSSANITNCQKLLVFYNSVVNLTNSINVEVIDSTITASNLSDCFFEGITATNILTDAPSGLTGIRADRNTSIGKSGNSTQSLSASTLTKSLVSYIDTIDQILSLSADVETYTVNLDNVLKNANGEFRIKINYSTTNFGTTINFQRPSDNTLIYTADYSLNGCTLIFRWNKAGTIFQLFNIINGTANTHSVQEFIATNNQTSFTLNTMPTNANLLEMYINGNKQKFGNDFTYTTPGIITFLAPDFNLASGDKIEFVIY